MKKNIKLLFACMLLFLSTDMQAQCTLTIQPDSIQGKDTYVRSLDCGLFPNNCDTINFGNSPAMLASTWTNSGNAKDDRAYLEFDLSSINSDSCGVISAILYLHHDNINDTDHCGELSTWHPCKKNDFEIRRLLEDWNEDQLTWLNQPNFSQDESEENYVYVDDSSFISYKSYSIDITAMANFWIENSEENFGMALILKTEFDRYRRVRFATSDNDNALLWPKLILNLDCDDCNTTAINTVRMKNTFKATAYPNPTGNTLKFYFSGNENYFLTIYNALGKVLKEEPVSRFSNVGVSFLSSGLYIYMIEDEKGNKVSGKFIKK